MEEHESIGDQTSGKRASERHAYFNFEKEIGEYDRSVVEAVGKLQRGLVGERIVHQNAQHFSHGRTWSHRANPDDEPGEMSSISAETSIAFDDLIRGDFVLLPKFIADVVSQLQTNFHKMLYQTMSDACDKSGNVVSAREAGSLAETFKAALSKIEFGVDPDGKVSMPEFHVGPGVYEKLLAELESQPPEFQEEIERIKDEKTQAALKREQERRAKFAALAK